MKSEYDPWYHPPTAPPADQPPPAGAPDPPPDITYDPGYNPNYGDIIKHDPGYLAARNAADYAASTGAATRRQTLRDALIRYGGLPAGFKDQYGDFDQATLELAKNNSHSILSQMAQNDKLQHMQLQKSLAARGMLQSSELGFGNDQLSQAYSQNQYDASNAFGSGAQNAIGQYTGILGQNARDLAAAIANASHDARANNQPRAAKTAHYNANLSTQWGRPIYEHKDEITGETTYYSRDGKEFKGTGAGGNWWN